MTEIQDTQAAQWTVTVAGPDDVHRFDTELDALRFANQVNRTYLADLLAHPGDEVLCLATVTDASPSIAAAGIKTHPWGEVDDSGPSDPFSNTEFGDDAIQAPDAAALAAPAPQAAAEPVAWAVYWGLPPNRKHSVHFERATAEGVAATIKSATEIRPLVLAAPTGAAPAQANVARTAPKSIYLVIGEGCPPEADFTDCDEVTWCKDKIDANSIKYVRADLAAQPQTKPAAPAVAQGEGTCISAKPGAQRPHRPDDFCADLRCGPIGQCIRTPAPAPAAPAVAADELPDEQADCLVDAAIDAAMGIGATKGGE